MEGGRLDTVDSDVWKKYVVVRHASSEQKASLLVSFIIGISGYDDRCSCDILKRKPTKITRQVRETDRQAERQADKQTDIPFSPRDRAKFLVR